MNNKNETAARSEYLYLQRLNYDPELENRWFAFFVKNSRLTLLMVAVLFIVGLFAFFRLPRESTPEVKIPIGVVATLLPGANPQDVEEQITQKLERSIGNVSGVDKISSVSQESVSTITVEFGSNENLDDAIRRLRDTVADAKTGLPAEAKEPIVTQVRFEDRPIWVLGLTGPYDGFTLRGFASDAKDSLEKVANVSKVEISGGNEAEFEIAYDPDKLAQYNLSIDGVNNAVKATNVTFPIGSYQIGNFNYAIRVDSKITSASQLRNLAIAGGDHPIYLRDVAMVSEKAIKHDSIVRFSTDDHKTEPGVVLSVFKRSGGSIINIVDNGSKQLANLQKSKLPADVSFVTVVDQASQIRTDFDNLSHDALLTFGLVFTSLLVIIGLREGLIAALAVPLVFAVSLTVLYLLGISLNFLSLFSLILSLGLLVDDAIVVVSATNKYFRSGKFTPEQGIILVLNDFKGVLLTTTLTTVWAFAPLIFASGILGQFIKSIPITVSITLIASLVIAITVNHPMAAILERLRPIRLWFVGGFALTMGILIALVVFVSNRFGFAYFGLTPTIIFSAVLAINLYRLLLRSKLIKQEELLLLEKNDPQVIKARIGQRPTSKRSLLNRLTDGIFRLDFVFPYYERLLRFLFASSKRRRLVLATIILLFLVALAMPVFKLLPLEFFPRTDQDLMYVTIEGPANWTLENTDKIAQRIEPVLLSKPEINNFSVVVGAASLNQSGFVTFGAETNRANITINLKPKSQRQQSSLEIAKILRQQFAQIRQAKVSVVELAGGPPAGAAFTANVSGDDLPTLEKIALDFKSILEGINGTINQDVSIRHGSGQFTIQLDQQKLQANKLNAAIVASTLRSAVSGSEVTKILRDSKDIKVIANFDKDTIPTIDQLQNTPFVNLAGQPVYLGSVADIKLEDSLVAITRTNQKRTVVVTADAQGVPPNQILAEFQKRSKGYELPTGYEVSFGGVNEQFTQSVQSVLQSMVIALALIIITLVIQFNSYRKVFIVLVTIPLAVSGAFYGLTVARIPLSFPGLIGVLALFGIVVKNAIILVDKMNLNIRMGIGFTDAIIDAAKSRLEAIFLTSIATIFGILPITLSNPLWKALGSALISGLALSTFLTLLIVPLLYYVLIPADEKSSTVLPPAKPEQPSQPDEPLNQPTIQGTIWKHP